jgi:subtilisin family serine protease
MHRVRRAVVAILLCAAPLIAVPADASTSLVDRSALREVLRSQARAASHGVLALPLPEGPRAAAAMGPGELAAITRNAGPERLLVGARTHADLPRLAAKLRRLGARPVAFETIGVLAARVPSGAAAVAALRGDGRVAYVERDRTLRVAADPFDAVDAATGLKFTWFYDHVRAAEALAAAGGGSTRSVAVIDTGLDVRHPEFGGAARIGRTFDTLSRGPDVTDLVGHGTFVSGLIAAVDGNGIGGKGVAGNTKLVAVRASRDGTFTVGDLIRGIEFSIRAGADVLNMSLAGQGFSRTQARALDAAFFNDVLPVAASGNNALSGNPLEFPAAAVGGARGRVGIGLSVAATKPNGAIGAFSNHNQFVSIAAPGAAAAGCAFGVFSTLPARAGTAWDHPASCSQVFPRPEGRYGYAEGTSFSAPIVSGIAAVVWQVERRLASEQVAEVLTRSARQTIGTGWNEFTGHGIVDGATAAGLARAYDVRAPVVRGRARRSGQAVTVRLRRARDRTEPGRELAGGVTYSLLVSRDGGRDFDPVARRRKRPISKTVRLHGRRTNVIVATACDRNGNCGVRRLGRFRP